MIGLICFGITVPAQTNRPSESSTAKAVLAKEGKNLIPGDSSFETGHGIMTSGPWNLGHSEIITNEGVDGKQCLKVAGGMSALLFETKPGNTYTFSLYARGESNNVKATLGLIRDDICSHHVFTNIVLNKKWARYHLTTKAKNLDYWPVFRGVTAWVDACQFEEGGNPTPYRNSEPVSVGVNIPNAYNYVFLPGEDITLDFAVYKAWKEVKNVGLFSYRISDFRGTTVKQVEKEIVLDGDGKFKETFILPEKPGLYVVRSQFKSVDCVTSNTVSFAVVNPPVEIVKGLEPFCALNGGSVFPDTRRIGAHWADLRLRWDKVEPEKGKFDWSCTNEYFYFKKQGMKVSVCLQGHIPKWTWDIEESAEAQKVGMAVNYCLLPAKDHLEAWRNFIHEAAVRCKDMIDIWEIGGEDDLIWGRNPYYREKYPESVTNSFVVGPVADRLGEMIIIAAREIKIVNPKARIGAIRPSGEDCNPRSSSYAFSREIFKRVGREIDAFPLDCYCFPPRYLGPDKDQPDKSPLENMLTNTLNQANALTRKYGIGQPIYISEFGYALDINEPPDSKYALEIVKRLSRTFLIARATPNLLFCRWFVDQGCRQADKYEYGIWRNGYPLATVPAFSAVARIVENVVESKAMDLSPEVKAVIFRKANTGDAADGMMEYIRRIFKNTDQAVGAVWMIKGEGKITIASAEGIVVSDVMGNPIQPERSGNEMTFAIGEFPVYLGMNGRNSFKRLNQAVSKANLCVAPLEMTFSTPRVDKGVLYLHNMVNQDLKANISFGIRGKTLTKEIAVPMKGLVSLDIPLAGDMRKEMVSVEADCGAGFEKVAADFAVEFEKCAKMTFPLKIDGDLSKWKDHPCILMNERGQILPSDPWISWNGTDDLSAKVYVGWDATNFYMTAEVTDDKHFNNQTGSDIWNGDCIQFAFDSRSDGCLSKWTGYGDDDYDLGIALTKNGTAVYEWTGPVKDLWQRSEYVVVRDEVNKTTCYEMKIPWSALKMTPKEGDVFSFSFVIFDDDEGAGQTYWCQLSYGITNGKNPALFRRFVLSK